MAEQRRQPAFLAAVLALLGVYTLPQAFKMSDDGAPAPQSERSAAAAAGESALAGDEKEPSRRILKPLIDYLSDGQSAPEAPGKAGKEPLGESLKRQLGGATVSRDTRFEQ
jgi:hypothetical protein